MRSAGQVLGALFIIVGIVFLVGTLGGGLGLVEMLPWLWPLLLVALGVWFVLAAAERRRAAPPAWGAGGGPGAGMDAGTTAARDTTSASSTGTDAGWAGAGAGAAPGTDAGWAGTGAAPGTDATSGSRAGEQPGAWPGPGDPGGWSAAGAGRTGSAYPGGWPREALRQQRFIGEVEVAGVFEAGPMRIETFIGELRIDLTHATFPEGETPIRVNTGIGEVRVLLPADIPAAVRVSTLLGEAEAIGHTAGPVLGETYGETEGFANAQRRIRLEAQALIGEVAVRRARPDPTASDAPGSGFAPMSRPAAPPPPGTPDRTEPPA